MATTCGFGQVKDLRLKQLCIGNKIVIDEFCNITAKNVTAGALKGKLCGDVTTKQIKEKKPGNGIRVIGDLDIDGMIVVDSLCGDIETDTIVEKFPDLGIQVNGNITFLNNIIACGNLLIESIEEKSKGNGIVVNGNICANNKLFVDFIGGKNNLGATHCDALFAQDYVLFSPNAPATTLPATIAEIGRRFTFDPEKAAVRAGEDKFGFWEDANIGFLSFATGNSPLASGALSFAVHSAKATGDVSFAMHTGLADGPNSFASGTLTRANGEVSAVFGQGTIANAKAMVAMGNYNATVADALLVVGKGTGDMDRADALTLDTQGNLFVCGDICANANLQVGTIVPKTPEANVFVDGNLCIGNDYALAVSTIKEKVLDQGIQFSTGNNTNSATIDRTGFLSANFGACIKEPFLRETTPVSIDSSSDVLYTPEQIFGGIIVRNPLAGSPNDELPSAEDLVKAIEDPAIPGNTLTAGCTLYFCVINVDDEGTVEIASNVADGNTNAIVGGNIISSTSSAKFALRLDNITNPTESYTLYRCC